MRARISELRAAATGPREGIRATWQKSTPQVSVRRVILEWDDAEVAAEATAAINEAYQAYGDQLVALVEFTLNMRDGQRWA